MPAEDGTGVLEIRRDRLFQFMREFDVDLAVFHETNDRVEGVPEDWRDEAREELRYWRAWSADVGDYMRAVLRAVTVIERPADLPDDKAARHPEQTLEYIIGTDPAAATLTSSCDP